MIRALRTAAAIAVAVPGAAVGQAAPAVHWIPPSPLEGSLVTIVVSPVAPGARAVQGTLGDEPLHFESDSTGAYRADAGVPLAGPDSVPLTVVVLDRLGDVRRVDTAVGLVRRSLRAERIRVSARFADPPDSALAVRIAHDRERIGAVFARAHETPRLWHARFVRPRRSSIRSRFGTPRIVNGAARGRHWGVDFAGALGAPVHAANRAVVALVIDSYYGGCAVYLDHGAGLVTGYLHLSAVLVSRGDTVDAGQLFGRVGASGRVTGPHLHWLAHFGATSVDPLDLPRLKPWAAAAAALPDSAGARARAAPECGG